MNYYQILGLRATATQEEIDVAYKAAGTSHDFERQLEVNMAYSVLSDEAKRDQFDAELLRDLQRKAIDQTPPPPSTQSFSKLADGEYFHHHYHTHTNAENGDNSLLKTSLIWFIMAMATVFVVFFMAIVAR